MEARVIDQLYTVKETCELLKVNRSTLYQWEKGGLLTPSRPAPRRIYYTETQIRDFLNPPERPEIAIAPRTTRKKKR